MNFTDKTPNQLARIAGDSLSELNKRTDAILDDWVEFHLLKAMSGYCDGAIEAFQCHCFDMNVDADGNAVDEDGNPIGDGFREQVRGDYVMAQAGSAWA